MASFLSDLYVTDAVDGLIVVTPGAPISFKSAFVIPNDNRRTVVVDDFGPCLDGPFVSQFLLVVSGMVEVVERLLDGRFTQAFSVGRVHIVPLSLDVDLVLFVLHEEGGPSAFGESMFSPSRPRVVSVL